MLFRASALDRAGMRCPGSNTLPRVRRGAEEAAAAGVAAHADLLRPGRLPPTAQEWLGPEPMFERTLLVDWRRQTARWGSYAEAGAGESCGTFDAATVANSGEVRVLDVKSGRGHALGGALPRPSESWQLRFYACALLLLSGWTPGDFCDARVAWLTRGDGGWVLSEEQLPAEDAAETCGSLAELSSWLADDPAAVWHTGPWCSGCAPELCPVMRGAVERLGLPGDASPGERLAAARAAVVLGKSAQAGVEHQAHRDGQVDLGGGALLVSLEREDRELVRVGDLIRRYPALANSARLSLRDAEDAAGGREALEAQGFVVKTTTRETRVRRTR